MSDPTRSEILSIKELTKLLANVTDSDVETIDEQASELTIAAPEKATVVDSDE
jgi:hypothetical protein